MYNTGRPSGATTYFCRWRASGRLHFLTSHQPTAINRHRQPTQVHAYLSSSGAPPRFFTEYLPYHPSTHHAIMPSARTRSYPSCIPSANSVPSTPYSLRILRSTFITPLASNLASSQPHLPATMLICLLGTAYSVCICTPYTDTYRVLGSGYVCVLRMSIPCLLNIYEARYGVRARRACPGNYVAKLAQP